MAKSLLLENGRVLLTGSTRNVVDEYFLKPYHLKSEVDLLNDVNTRRGYGEARFTEICINNNNPIIDPTKDFSVRFKVKIFEEIESLLFNLTIYSQSNEEIASSYLLEIIESINLANEHEFEFIIKSNTFRTGIFPLYFWIGKRGENKLDNYHYDVIDRLYYFNFSSILSKDILGYDSINPYGYMNLDLDIKKK